LPNLSALTSERQDGGASGVSLILLTLPLSGRQRVPGTRSELVVACPLKELVVLISYAPDSWAA